MSSLSSAWKSVSENIWAAKSHELWRSKFEYAAQILLLTDFQAKERLLAVYMSFSVCKLFCCFLTGGIEGTIILAIMNSPLRCLYDLATELIVGKIMYKFDKQCKFYILGQGSTYLFIYLLFFILLLNCVAANTFGIWNLRNTEKSVTNWVTHTLLWKVWTQESFQKYVEFDRPRERSHCQQQQSYSGLRSPGWSNSTHVTHVIVYTTLILICLLLDAFL